MTTQEDISHSASILESILGDAPGYDSPPYAVAGAMAGRSHPATVHDLLVHQEEYRPVGPNNRLEVHQVEARNPTTDQSARTTGCRYNGNGNAAIVTDQLATDKSARTVGCRHSGRGLADSRKSTEIVEGAKPEGISSEQGIAEDTHPNITKVVIRHPEEGHASRSLKSTKEQWSDLAKSKAEKSSVRWPQTVLSWCKGWAQGSGKPTLDPLAGKLSE